MSIPDATVSFLLQNLSQAISYNVSLVSGLGEKFTVLQRELESLRALMKDFTQYNHDSEYIKEKVKQIREVLCDAEDAVDSYLVHTIVKESKKWAKRWFHNVTDIPLILRDIGKRIRLIRDQVKNINEEVQGANLLNYLAIRSLDHASSSSKPKQAPIVEEDHVIGFEGAIEEVTNRVYGGAEQFEAISIVGMLGLGKTTLAKQVYKDQKVEYEYRIRAFVYVSQEYERKDIFHKILLSLKAKINYDVEKATDEDLEKRLHRELLGKSYLIVLDDMWVRGDWDNLQGAFLRNNAKRCRVLMTTRNEEVATYSNPRIGCFKLDFLTRDKSKELLRWKVFEGGEFPSELECWEAAIMDKCEGLPLAIVVIGGILCNDHHNVLHWRDVAKGVQGYIARDETKTRDVILVMYKHLPNHLKRCFLYMGVFKEDSEILVWKLIRLWIAEGLIEEEEEHALEEVAWRNMKELVYRNLVMVAKRSSNGRTKTCRMHDTLREFCKKQAEQENLFKEIKKDNITFFKSKVDELGAYRRLCINSNNVVDYISSNPYGKCVRSFLTFNMDKIPIEATQVSSLPKSFKLLKVMEVESLIFVTFPPQLCHLVLLKYVAISSNFSTLPKVMSKMWNLQTLIVNTTITPLDVYANIWNVSTILPHLPPPDAKRNKLHIKSPSIQTLSSISPKSCSLDAFIRTPEIKKLGVRGTGVMKLFEAQSTMFGILSNLETFKLMNDDASTIYSSARLSNLNFPQ